MRWIVIDFACCCLCIPLSPRAAGRIVGLVYMSGVVENACEVSPTKNRASLDAYCERLVINLAPTQMSVGMG